MEKIEAKINDLDDSFKDKVNRLTSIKDVCPMIALAFVSDTPELGTLSNKEISALVGVASLCRDSRTMRGERTIFFWGGA